MTVDPDDFDRGFPDGKFTMPSDPAEPRYNWRELVKYCEEKEIHTDKLTQNELRKFQLDNEK